MNAKVQNIVREFERRLSAHYGERLVKLVLYGSQARGDAEEASDIDVLVVLQEPFSFEAERLAIGDIAYDLSSANGVLISCAVESADRFDDETYKTPFLRNVRREGIAL